MHRNSILRLGLAAFAFAIMTAMPAHFAAAAGTSMVQQASSLWYSPATIALPSTKAGDLIVVVARWENFFTMQTGPAAMTDSEGNVCKPLVSGADSSGVETVVSSWYCPNIKGGSDTISITGPKPYSGGTYNQELSVSAYEFAGIDTSADPLENAHLFNFPDPGIIESSLGSGVLPNVSFSTNGLGFFSWQDMNTGGQFDTLGGWTAVANSSTPRAATGIGHAEAYDANASAGPLAMPVFETWDNARHSVIVMASFRAAGSAPATTPPVTTTPSTPTTPAPVVTPTAPVVTTPVVTTPVVTAPVVTTVSQPVTTTAPVSTTPVAYYTLDESSGTSIADSSGNGHTAKAVNMSLANASVAGQVGGALSFNGSSQYIVTASPGAIVNPAVSDLSVSAWVNVSDFTEDSGAVNRRILLQNIDGNNAFMLTTGDDNIGSHDLTFAIDKNGTVIEKAIAGPLAVGTWYHVTATWNHTSNTIQIYVNGISQALSTQSSLLLGNGDDLLYLGERNDGAGYFKGSLDDVQIYNRILAPSEISTASASAPVTAPVVTTPVVTAPNFSIGSAAISVTGSNQAGSIFSTSTITGNFSITVQATGANVSFGTQAASVPMFAFKVFDGSGNDITSKVAFSSVSGFLVPSGTAFTATGGASFQLPASQTATMSNITFSFPGKDSSGQPLSNGPYSIAISKISYSVNGTTQSQTFDGESAWKTSGVNLPAQTIVGSTPAPVTTPSAPVVTTPTAPVVTAPVVTTSVVTTPVVNSSSGSSGTDTSAPSTPAGFYGYYLRPSLASSLIDIYLNWKASTDSTGVAGYNVYRNGVKVASVTTTSYSDIGFPSGPTYIYTVSAYDAAGNASSQSAPVYISSPGFSVSASAVESFGAIFTNTFHSFEVSVMIGLHDLLP